MKCVLGILVLLGMGMATGYAQMKNQNPAPRISQQISNPTQIGSSFLNRILDRNRLQMNQMYSISYLNAGGKGMTMGMYLNSLSYQISEKIDTRLHLGFTHSPFGGNNSYLNQGQFIGGAELNYRPSRNTLLQFKFSQVPGTYLSGFSSGFIPFTVPSSSPADGN